MTFVCAKWALWTVTVLEHPDSSSLKTAVTSLGNGKGRRKAPEEVELPQEKHILVFEFLLFISQKGRDPQQSDT